MIKNVGTFNKETRKQSNLYVCDWCKYEFYQTVGKGYGQGKNSKPVSSQVVCPSCGNFMPTWK